MNQKKIAALLNQAEEQTAVRLSAYGYVTHMLYTKGAQAALNTTLVSPNSVKSYAERATAEKESIAAMLLNALNYFENLMASYGMIESALHHLNRMVEPHLLYLLLAGSFKKYAARYEAQAADYFRRFPGSADSLPEDFTEVIKRLTKDDSPDEGGACSAPHTESTLCTPVHNRLPCSVSCIE